MIQLIVLGSTGRMGQSVIRQVELSTDLSLAGTVSRQDTPRSFHELMIKLGQHSAILIDFSLPGVIEPLLPICIEHQLPIVSGVTGLTTDQHGSLKAAANKLPVLWASNMSVGIELLQMALRCIGQNCDSQTGIEVLDVHHSGKRDAPSGTAITLAESWLQASNVKQNTSISRDQIHLSEHEGELTGQYDSIRFKVKREGNVIGDHQIQIDLGDEILHFSHHAKNRDVFASGAIRAVRWLINQPIGYYLFADQFRVE